MKHPFIYIVAILFATSFFKPLFSQNNNLQNTLNPRGKVKIQSIIFDEIEAGILNNDLKSFSQYFTSQPYISLINGVNGYYSSNQTYYILEDFFNSFKVVSFSFEEKKTEESVSYGKGSYYFEKKGKREVAHLYITLSKAGNRWYITQISIN
ncbi:MAG: DUF4783 domain-containing protein [Ignavibacteriaceae bacterium]